MAELGSDSSPHVVRWTAERVLERYQRDFGGEGVGNPAHGATMWRIIALCHLILADLEQVLKELEIAPADLFVLAVLAIEPDGRLRPSDLARILSVTPAAISLRVAKLEKGGLLRRTSTAKDRRFVQLELTETGRQLAVAGLAKVNARGNFMRAMERLPVGQAEATEEAIARLAQEMERHVLKG